MFALPVLCILTPPEQCDLVSYHKSRRRLRIVSKWCWRTVLFLSNFFFFAAKQDKLALNPYHQEIFFVTKKNIRFFFKSSKKYCHKRCFYFTYFVNKTWRIFRLKNPSNVLIMNLHSWNCHLQCCVIIQLRCKRSCRHMSQGKLTFALFYYASFIIHFWTNDESCDKYLHALILYYMTDNVYNEVHTMYAIIGNWHKKKV